MLLVRLLQRVEAALGYEATGPLARADSRLKLLAALISITCLTMCRERLPLASCLTYPLILHAASPRSAARAAQASAPAVAGVFILFLAVNPYSPPTLEWAAYAATMAVRIYAIASTVLITVATTRPEALVAVVARIPLLHDTLVLFMRQAPLTVQDMYLAYAAQRLLGKPGRRALAGALLQSLYRGGMMEASILVRSAGHRGPRTPIVRRGNVRLGLLLFLAATIPALIAAYACLM